MKAMAVVLAVSCPPGHTPGVTVELTTFSEPGENEAMFKQREAGLLDWVRRHFGPAFPLELDGFPRHAHEDLVREIRLVAARLGVSTEYAAMAHPSNVLQALVSAVEKERGAP